MTQHNGVNRVWDDDAMPLFQWQSQIHAWAKEKGFWEGYEETNFSDLFDNTSWVLSKLMLAVTELAEAGEACRTGDYHNFCEEVADAVIRLFDTAHALGIDLATEMANKMLRNETRPYKHGKRA